MKLKKLYSSREVAAITGLSARQLQWWDQRRIFTSSIPSHQTERGGYTERRYTPIDLLELMVLADLRRRGFTVARLRRLLGVLRSRFKVRLYEAIEGGGPVTLYIDADKIYARTPGGDLFNVLDQPNQPLLMVGEQVRLRELTVRESSANRRKKATARTPVAHRSRTTGTSTRDG
jgi:DNA-binding transcriptional MerR regulator